jgi:hypothetical protein
MESINDDENMCGICYQTFNELEPSHSINCSKVNHLYHSKCLKCWYNRLRELPNIYDDNNKIVNKPVCPLCSDNKNIFVDKNFWSILRTFQFEETIKKESESCKYRLNTILLEEEGELLSNPELFERVRKDKSLLYGYKIVEYKCNPCQESYINYRGPRMFKKENSFIFKEKSFEDTYINDTGDFALSATINNITEHPSNRDMYILIPPTIIDKPLSYSKIIFNVIFILVIILYYLI